MPGRGPNRISYRLQVSVLLIAFAALAMVLPDRQRRAGELSPSETLNLLQEADRELSPDQVAASLIREDSTILLIDLRDSTGYLETNIPGAINIPFRDLMNPDWAGYLDDPSKTKVLYDQDGTLASAAWLLCSQAGYKRMKIMKGGLVDWNRTILESDFSGERISAAENAVFEIRYRARTYYNLMNSLPDSLKTAYLQVKRKKEAELVGGCE